MFYGLVIMGLCYFVVFMCLKVVQDDLSKKMEFGKVIIVMFFMYYWFYGMSFVKVLWVYNFEVNSFGWCICGVVVVIVINWFGGFIVIQFIKVGVNNLGWKFYLSMLCYFDYKFI